MNDVRQKLSFFDPLPPGGQKSIFQPALHFLIRHPPHSTRCQYMRQIFFCCILRRLVECDYNFILRHPPPFILLRLGYSRSLRGGGCQSIRHVIYSVTLPSLWTPAAEVHYLRLPKVAIVGKSQVAEPPENRYYDTLPFPLYHTLTQTDRNA